jgi:hypothetical protein
MSEVEPSRALSALEAAGIGFINGDAPGLK